MSLAEIKGRLRSHPSGAAWPGGYPLYWVTSDGAALAWHVVRDEWRNVVAAHLANDTMSGWHIAGWDINWEDTELICDHTGERIPSAYGD